MKQLREGRRPADQRRGKRVSGGEAWRTPAHRPGLRVGDVWVCGRVSKVDDGNCRCVSGCVSAWVGGGGVWVEGKGRDVVACGFVWMWFDWGGQQLHMIAHNCTRLHTIAYDCI